MDPETTVAEMAKYARFAAEEYGSKVDTWATLNEPLAVVMAGFLMPTPDRTNPPGLALQADRAVTALFAMAEAHARVADAVRDGDLEDADGDSSPARVGIVHAVGVFSPLDIENEADQAAADHAFALYNRVFLDAAVSGDLDTDLDGTSDGHRDDLAGRTDFIGVNYYFRTVVRGIGAPIFGEYPLLDFLPVEFVTDPAGMAEALVFASGYGLPLYVTECGVDDPAGDETGPAFLTAHLLAVGDAVAQGIDVRGFFYWSLVDNYEWNHGMDMRFGLYALDPLDPLKQRSPKLSAGIYARVAVAGGVPVTLANAWGR
jgi:beta-glucosidase/6-phospho-beta-glucosidase/beta-galactosidase